MKKLLLLAILAGFSIVYVRGAQAVFMLSPNSCVEHDTQCLNNLYYKQQQAQALQQQAQAISQLKTEQENLRRQLELQSQLNAISTPYVPLPVYHYNTYVPTYTGSVEGASTVKKIVWPPISKEDKKAPDFIQNKNVASTVDRIFNEVWNRKPDKDESGWWKVRARHDKATEIKLRKTMQYFQSKGWTYSDNY